MSTQLQRAVRIALGALCLACLAAGTVVPVHAQTPPKAKAPAAPRPPAGSAKAPQAAPAPAAKTPPPPAVDSPEREQILHSRAWQQTIADFESWLSSQTLYDAQQVKQTRARLEVGISRMTPAQLQWFENDMQAKLKVLNSDQAQEAAAYLAQTLAVASPAYARKVRQKLPDVLTAPAGQISQQLAGFAAKRDATAQMQQAFNDNRQQQIAHNQTQIAAQQQILNQDLGRESDGAINATKGNKFTAARDYFPNAGNDGPFGPGTSIGFWGGGFF
ncbi:MAG TPA: hypothetical protein VHD36_00490 [Pirellulales bacterium]|nr:hypothetical protein [Pirellulales bacterium]